MVYLSKIFNVFLSYVMYLIFKNNKNNNILVPPPPHDQFVLKLSYVSTHFENYF